MKKINLYFFLFFCLFSLSGCVILFTGHQKTTFVTKTKGTSISIIESNTFLGKPETTFIGRDSVRYVINNNNDYYELLLEQEHYKSRNYVINKTRFNPAKILDLVIPIVGTLVLATQIKKQTLPDEVIVPVLFVSAIGWVGNLYGNSHIFEKKITLPALSPIIKRKEEERYLFLDSVNVRINPGDYKWNYYDDYKSFKRDFLIHKSQNETKMVINNFDLYLPINKILYQCNYSDTNQRKLSSAFNALNINCTISGITQSVVGNFTFLEISTTWKFNNRIDGREIFKKTYISESDWMQNKGDNDMLTKEMLNDAVEYSILSLLNDPQISPYLENIENKFDEAYKNWDTLKIDINGHNSESINEVVKSVVTIKTKTGHGSGCIISNEGYIITNYHVVGENNTMIEAIFEDGTKTMCEVVRSNPIFDLALLKTSSLKTHPLKISPLNTFETGAEVFAIGTPNDIDLGQTVSKGIISGKRKYEGKVYIQSDVSINKGNSGGALVTKDGILIGIVNAKIIGLGVEGVGFAIPAYYVNDALKIVVK